MAESFYFQTFAGVHFLPSHPKKKLTGIDNNTVFQGQKPTYTFPSRAPCQVANNPALYFPDSEMRGASLIPIAGHPRTIYGSTNTSGTNNTASQVKAFWDLLILLYLIRASVKKARVRGDRASVL
jgi:hypothetical protein